MFVTLRLGQVGRLLRSPVSPALLRVNPLNTPGVLARRTFLTSARPATKNTARKTASAKKAKTSKKKTVAKKKPAARKPKKEKAPKIDRKLLKPPKRPASPFVIYCAENFNGNPKTIAEVNVLCRENAVKWHALPENFKEEYRQRAQGQLKEYRKEYERWYNSLTPEQLKEAKRLRKNKKRRTISPPGEQPKRPANAFIQFFQDYRKERAVLGFDTGLSKEAGMAWKGLSQSEKNAYAQRYLGALEQHRKDMEAYKRQFS
ncbi:hypothetical protein L218DRAFT_673093 [Marasmius fiardii PR-910]|nr:hypothetical protein L218DRAFT_673093 [Marasmius fiardii PR-910]